MFVFPNTNQCGWAGLGYVPGQYSYINGTLSVQVMTHELGHNFGLAHANAASCSVGGDTGDDRRHLGVHERGLRGPVLDDGQQRPPPQPREPARRARLAGRDEKVVAVPGNTYTITPYFGTAGVKLVRVPRGDGTFFDLDYRMTYSVFDTFSAGSAATTGVTIRLARGTASPTTSPQVTTCSTRRPRPRTSRTPR